VYFQASDDSLHSIPRNQLKAARRVDPGLEVVQVRKVNSFQVTTIRRRLPKFRPEERDVLRTLYYLSFT